RLSAVGAVHDAPTRSGRLHALSDRETEASGLRWTILRPLWFMQNLLNEAGEVAAAGTLSLNMASARLGMVDARDVAACAARVLLDAPDRHHGAAYTLSGPRPVSFDEVADHLGRALGRPVAYRPVDDGAKRAALLGHGVPEWIADMLEEYARAYASGWGDFTTGAVAGLLGRPPRDIADFARDHAAAFAPAAGAWGRRSGAGGSRRRPASTCSSSTPTPTPGGPGPAAARSPSTCRPRRCGPAASPGWTAT